MGDETVGLIKQKEEKKEKRKHFKQTSLQIVESRKAIHCDRALFQICNAKWNLSAKG